MEGEGQIVLQVAPGGGQPFAFPLTAARVVVGRSSSADLVIEDGYLSRQHCEILRRDDGFVIRDLGSRNGTLVNGTRIDRPTPLRHGDRIQISSSAITVESGEPVLAAAPPAVDSVDGTVFLSASELSERFTGGAVGEAGQVDFERQSERLSILNEVHRALAGSIELAELLELILDRAFDHLGPEQGSVFLEAEEAQAEGAGQAEEGRWNRVAGRKTSDEDEPFYSTTLIRQVAEEGMAALVLDASVDERYGAAAERKTVPSTESIAGGAAGDPG